MNNEQLQQRLRDFALARDWNQFHNPKNLAMALTGEAGELAAIFQWLTPREAVAVMEHDEVAAKVRHEIADVFGYVLRLADVLDVDLEAALVEKLAINEQRYPVALAKGNARKYSDLKDDR